ncbi:hypothetical protein GJAV_G00069940 [Gymnothorax javanicus]|nr:hypothetical protein GJAV_G00069940 [Gymnothorax javanicus]
MTATIQLRAGSVFCSNNHKHQVNGMTGTVATFLLLALCFPSITAPPSQSPCDLLPVGEDHPVQAMLKSFTALSGCAGKGTMALPQEVHIINLRSRGPQEPAKKLTEVILHVRPMQSLPVHQKPLVFVLNSLVPVLWTLKTVKLAPHVKRTFHVTEGSQVHFEPGNFSLSCEVLEETLPHGNKHLLTWGRRRYTAVTSFSELKVAHDIYIKVGEDPVFPDTCEIDNKILSLNCLASYVQPQISRGCVQSGLDEDREVHIIELQALNSSSAFQVDVVVDIKPQQVEGPLLHRDLVLVLKCGRPVNWVILVSHIVGKLEILTSGSISLSPDTERLMQVSKTRKRRLPSGSQALIHWAEERGFSPVTSFTSASVANHFNLRLRGPGLMDSTFPPELAVLLNLNPHPRHQSSAPSVGPPIPFPWMGHPPKWVPPHLPLPPSERGPLRLGTKPQEQHGSLSVGLSVQCERNRMVVTVDKLSLQASGYGGANLTLQDSRCKATSNATHYILETPLIGCQTAKYPFHPSPVIIYINSVFINPSESEDGRSWPVDYEDMESGDVGLPVNTEDTERAVHVPLGSRPSIMFNCTYWKNLSPGGRLPRVGPRRGRVNDVTFNMELYNTDIFHYPATFVTTSENKPIFVEVSITKAEKDLGFMIQACFISPNSNANIHSDYTLIENICPIDDSVKYYPQHANFPLSQTQMDRKRFSFIFRSKFNVSLLFLHCSLSPCTKRHGGDRGLPECIQPDEACISVNMDLILAMALNTKTSTKPLVVVSDQKPAEPPVPSIRSIPQTPTDGRGNIIYVLDTPVAVGIALTAFVIGVLLSGALWFIYAHTGDPVRGPQKSKSPPSSGNSNAAHSIGSTLNRRCSRTSTV